jgi:ABC-type uncharacterized transport system permease subunit
VTDKNTKRPKIKTAVIFAIISAGLGVAWLSYLSPDHTACSSALVASVNQSACQSDALRWYLAWGLVAIGVILVILALIEFARTPRGSDASRFCEKCGQPVGAAAKHCGSYGTELTASTD